MFQGQSARSKHWFDFNIGWVEENVSTIESQFYKRLFKINIEGRSGYKYPTFPVPVVNAKEIGEIEYEPKVPLVKYHQKLQIVFASVV